MSGVDGVGSDTAAGDVSVVVGEGSGVGDVVGSSAGGVGDANLRR